MRSGVDASKRRRQARVRVREYIERKEDRHHQSQYRTGMAEDAPI